MCIRKPEPEPETRFWIFQTRKPGFGRTAPGLETLQDGDLVEVGFSSFYLQFHIKVQLNFISTCFYGFMLIVLEQFCQ